MDKIDTIEHMAYQQWLLKQGIINDFAKDNLHGYGSLIHEDVKAVYTKVDHPNKVVEYTIYVSNKLLTTVDKYNRLRNDSSMYGLWKFKNFLKKAGNLNFDFMINQFVQDYCGNTWSATLDLISIDKYRDDLENEKEESTVTDSAGGDKPSDG